MVVDPRVVDANEKARRVLKALHHYHLEHAGAAWHLYVEGPNDELLKVLDLDETGWRAATARLVDKGLAEWVGAGSVTSTPYGIEVAEDDGMLDAELPVGPRARGDVEPTTASALAEITGVALAFVADDAIREIVERDRRELELAVAHGMHKSAALLAGSISEALLLDVCDRNRVISASYLPAKKRFPEDASLGLLIEIGEKEGLLSDLAHPLLRLKDYRDLVHPDRERRLGVQVDAATSGALVQLLRLVLRDLAAAADDGRIEGFAAR